MSGKDNMRAKGFVRATADLTSTAAAALRQRTPELTPTDAQKRSRSPMSTMEHFKRHSLPGLTGKNKEKSKESKGINQTSSTRPQKPVNTLDMIAESPPSIFYGSSEQSTGALFSGQLRMTVVDSEVTLGTFEMALNVVVSTKRPVTKDCADCMAKITQLHKWTFIKEPIHLSPGQHYFPFSYLLPGHLPTTTYGHIGVLQYFLDAKAVAMAPPVSPTEIGFSGGVTTLNMHQELPLWRAMPESRDKSHVRVFPPTNLATHVTFAPVIYPIGEIPVHMRINGCVERDDASGTQLRWRLRKMTWKLEEKEVMIGPACLKHGQKSGGHGKGSPNDETRVIGQGDVKSGWKTDFSDATIEMEFSCRPSGNPRPLCDVNSPYGLKVTHDMIIELVISEELARNRTPDQATPTGSARVLRMQFPVVVTERAGMGISWDEEAPPMYDDVPASPPVYPQKDYESLDNGPVEGTRGGGEVLVYTGPALGPTPSFEEELAGYASTASGIQITESHNEGHSGRQESSDQTQSVRLEMNQRHGRTRLSLDDFAGLSLNESNSAPHAEWPPT